MHVSGAVERVALAQGGAGGLERLAEGPAQGEGLVQVQGEALGGGVLYLPGGADDVARPGEEERAGEGQAVALAAGVADDEARREPRAAEVGRGEELARRELPAGAVGAVSGPGVAAPVDEVGALQGLEHGAPGGAPSGEEDELDAVARAPPQEVEEALGLVRGVRQVGAAGDDQAGEASARPERHGG